MAGDLLAFLSSLWRRRRSLALIGGLAVVASGVPALPAQGASHPSIHWSHCKDGRGPSGFQCATVTVPLNYADPGGATIAIALDRHPATGKRLGTLLINPGGPGASGVDFLTTAVSLFPSEITSHFDLIGFDPRGVARSAPVSCLNGAAMDRFVTTNPEPTTEAGFQQLVRQARLFARACQRSSGRELAHIDTVDTARDMDVIRQDLGLAQLNFLGFSYGTLLGATYAQLFPTHIRAMVLDGAIDPSLSAVAFDTLQAAGFDANLQGFFTACRQEKHCPWQPGTTNLTTAFQTLLAGIARTPLPGNGARELTVAEALNGVAELLYQPGDWPQLAEALNDAQRGDGGPLLTLSDTYLGRQTNGTYNNMVASADAVFCLDHPTPSPAALQADAATATAAAPVFGLDNLYSLLVCSEWPVHSTQARVAIHAPGSPPIVVVGSTLDPATPYVMAQALARQLAHGVLVTRVGFGHTGYLSSACVRRVVDAYLIDLQVPRKGVTCNGD